MKLVVCVDDKMGMMFNRRRQSKDVKVREDIISMLGSDQKLFVSPYTAKQFEGEELQKLYISESFLAEAGKDDFCFVEDADISEYVSKAEQLILYRWNRVYPADKHLTMDLTQYTLVSSNNFVGNSHPEMLKEIYKK